MQTGPHLLTLSSSPFDPYATSPRPVLHAGHVVAGLSLSIFALRRPPPGESAPRRQHDCERQDRGRQDRKSTHLNSSHVAISYAVFCLKKKKKTKLHGMLEKKKNIIIKQGNE